MLRSATWLFQRGFGSSSAAQSTFARRCTALKNKFRGKGLYAFARDEAQRFLDAEVPRGNVASWIEEGTNAIALSQLMRFFEINPDATISAPMLNRLIRFADDPSSPAHVRLEAVLSLMAARPDENFERAAATVEAVLHQLPIPSSPSSNPREALSLWSLMDQCAKVLQRSGKRVPPALNDRLAQIVVEQLQKTPPEELCYFQGSLLRIYAWMVRADLPQSTGVLFMLVEHTGDFKSYDFATLMRSCIRHHQTTALPVTLAIKLAQAGLQYASNGNGGDSAAILGGIARVLSSLEPGINEVQQRDIRALSDHFNALLEDFQARTMRFMDEKDSLYWNTVEDITTIAFAFELGGRIRYRHIFTAFQAYVRREAQKLEPQHLAMATGILRRSQLLTPDIADILAERIEVVLGELRLSELSHICATFATASSSPKWMPEALEVAVRLVQSSEPSNISAATRFNLSIAFPQETFAQPIEYAQFSVRQLVDALPLAVGKPMFEGPLVRALVAKLEDPTATGRCATDDVLLLLAAPIPEVVSGVQKYMERCLSEPEWSTDVLFTLPVAMQNAALYPLASNREKALSSAKTAAISPELFVALLELLVQIWKDTDPGINDFAIVGGMDLIQAPGLLGSTLTRYLNCISTFPLLRPSNEWLNQLAKGKTGKRIFKSFHPEDLVSFLAVMHGMFTSVESTPALEPVLADVVEASYQGLDGSTEVAARATVLLALLQQGTAVPLLTTSSPVVQRVKEGSALFSSELQEAIKCTPLPQGPSRTFATPSEGFSGITSNAGGGMRRGRFTMKSPTHMFPRDSGSTPLPTSACNPSDPLDLSEGDPFAENLKSATTTLPPPVDSAASATPWAPREEVAEPEQAEPSTPSPTPSMAENSFNAAAPTPVVDIQRNQEEPTEKTPGNGFGNTPPNEGVVPEKSYYSRFFNSALGTLFNGNEKMHHTTTPQSEPVQQESAAPLKPRRTVLRHTQSQSSAAPTEVPSTPYSPHNMSAFGALPQEMQYNAESRSYSGWGEQLSAAPPSTHRMPAPGSPSVSTSPSSGWGSTPISSPNLASNSPQGSFHNPSVSTSFSSPTFSSVYGVPSAAQNASFFSQLFSQNKQEAQVNSTGSIEGNRSGQEMGEREQPPFSRYPQNTQSYSSQTQPSYPVNVPQSQQFYNTQRNNVSVPIPQSTHPYNTNINVVQPPPRSPPGGATMMTRGNSPRANMMPTRGNQAQPSLSSNMSRQPTASFNGQSVSKGGQMIAQGGNLFINPMENNHPQSVSPPRTLMRPANVMANQTRTPSRASGAVKNYMRQPTFARSVPDHPKALRYSDHSLPSTPHPYNRTQQAVLNNHGGQAVRGTEGNYYHSGSERSGYIDDKREDQRSRLLREPADRPLAWRNAAERVSRVSRHTLGKSKPANPLSDWLASPSARLDKKGHAAEEGSKGRGKGTAAAHHAPATAKHVSPKGKGKSGGRSSAGSTAADTSASKGRGGRHAAPAKRGSSAATKGGKGGSTPRFAKGKRATGGSSGNKAGKASPTRRTAGASGKSSNAKGKKGAASKKKSESGSKRK